MTFFKYSAAAAIGAAAASLFFYFAIANIFTETLLHIGGSKADAAAAAAGASEKLYITADDGALLAALCLRQPEESGKWVLLLHGYTSGKEAMLSYAEKYFSAGYSVLIPDQRAHGESGGEYCTMGCLESLDTLKWTESIVRLSPSAEIVIHGVSMGAAAALMAAADGVNENVAVIISDCAFSSLSEIAEYQLSERLGRAAALLAPGCSTITKLRIGCSWRDISPLAAVASNITPTLFIHGAADAFIPVKTAHELYSAATGEKELCIIENAAHAEAMYKDTEKYWTAVFNFIEKHSNMHKNG